MNKIFLSTVFVFLVLNLLPMQVFSACVESGDGNFICYVASGTQTEAPLSGITLTKTGDGETILTGANDFTSLLPDEAAVNINSGALSLKETTSLTGDFKLNLNGGTFKTEGDFSFNNDVTFNGGNINVAGEGSVLSFTGGAGGIALTKEGEGLLELKTGNAYNGNLAINEGGVVTQAGSFNGNANLNAEEAFLSFEQDTDATFSGSVAGSGSLTKEGGATLILSAANTVAVTEITDGAISISSAGNIQGDIQLRGGELLVTDTISLGNGISQNIFFDSVSKGIAINAGETLTLDNGVTIETAGCDEFNNCAVVVKDGAGTLVLNHDTAGGRYFADTLINKGTLEVSDGNRLGDSRNKVIINDAVLKVTANTAIDNRLELLNNTSSLDITGTTILNANTIGNGSLTKEGAGTLLFGSGIMAHAGGTVINSGGIEGSTSGFAGNILVNSGSFLNFRQDSDGSSNTILSGAGTVNKFGAGIVNLANTNTFTGLFNIEAGGLRGSNKSFSSDMNMQAGTVVIFNHTCSTDEQCAVFNGEYSNTISGAGSLVKEGNAELYLSGFNTYSGGTYLQSSTRDEAGIYFTDEAALGTGNIYVSNGNLTVGGDMNAAREIIFGSGVNSLTVKSGERHEINALIDGTSFIKLGGGELALNADNSFEGGVMISKGTLTVSKESALGSGMLSLSGEGTLKATDSFSTDKLINVVGNAGFEVADGKTLALDYALYGGGTIIKKGLGTLELNYYNQYTGGLNLEEGLLRGDSYSILGDITIDAGAQLEFRQDFDDYKEGYTGDINSQGTITKSGAGILLMSGDSENLNLLSMGTLSINDGGIILASKFEGNAGIAQNTFLSLEADAKGNFESYGNFYIDNSKDINIEGDITIKNGGALNLFIEEGQTTQINVKENSGAGGNITIEDGGKVEINASGVFASAATFDFLNYEGAFTGDINNFDVIVANNRRLLAELTNDGDSLSFTITRLLSQNAKLSGLNKSQRSIASALDLASAAPVADMETVLNAVDDAALINSHTRALSQLGGFIYANLPNTFSRFKDNAYLRANRSPAQSNSFGKNLWVQIVNNFTDINETSTSEELYILSNGFSLGLDNYYEDLGLTAGLFAGYARHDLKHNKIEDLDGDEYQLGFYALKQGEIFDFKGAISAAYQADDIERNISLLGRTAKSRVKTYGVNLDLETGVKVGSIGFLALRPFAGITASAGKYASFGETGADSANLSGDDNINLLVQARAGIGLERKSSNFSYYADASIKQSLNKPKTELSIAGQKYEIEAADIGTVFGLSAGAVKTFSDDLSVYASGGMDINGDMQKYYLNFGLRTYW